MQPLGGGAVHLQEPPYYPTPLTCDGHAGGEEASAIVPEVDDQAIHALRDKRAPGGTTGVVKQYSG